MAQSQGRIIVPAAGTPIQVFVGHKHVHAVLIEALPTNTGKAFILEPSGVKGGPGELAILPIPTANTIPTFSETISAAPNALDLFYYFIDVDVSGEGVLVSYVVW